MEKIAIEQLRKIIGIFKLKSTISEVFVNNRGEFQFVEDKQFCHKVTREMAEEAAKELPAEPEAPLSLEAEDYQKAQALVIELTEAKNLLTTEKQLHEETAAKLEAANAEIEKLKEAAQQPAPAEEVTAQLKTLQDVISSQESDLQAKDKINKELSDKLAELNAEIEKLKKKGGK